MTIAAFTGRYPTLGMGHTDGGLTMSGAQLLIDREVAGGLKSLECPVIDEDAVGLDDILDIGFALDKRYLESDHTLKNYRTSLWSPQLLERTGWTPEAEERVLGRAMEKVKELTAEYRKPDVDPGMLAKVREIVERAKKELCG
jgi:trimethylamine:corrinoid methyltransferase-like protein